MVRRRHATRRCDDRSTPERLGGEKRQRPPIATTAPAPSPAALPILVSAMVSAERGAARQHGSMPPTGRALEVQAAWQIVRGAFSTTRATATDRQPPTRSDWERPSRARHQLPSRSRKGSPPVVFPDRQSPGCTTKIGHAFRSPPHTAVTPPVMAAKLHSRSLTSPKSPPSRRT